MNTFGLTSPVALSIRLLRTDGSVHSVAPHKRWPRVHNGALVILRKERLLPIVAINGDVADVVLGSGVRTPDDDMATVDEVAPMWRVETPKPPKAEKPAKAAKPAKPAAAPAQPDAIAALTARLEQLAEGQNQLASAVAAFLSAQTPKRGKRA